MPKLDIFKIFRGRKPEDEPKKLDPTPVALPAGYTVSRPLSEVIATMVQQAIADEKEEEYESLDEADDFDMDEDELLDLSPYELSELHDEDPIPETIEEPPEDQDLDKTPSEAPQEKNTPPEGETPA